MNALEYVPVFNKLGIKTVVRLNSVTYDKQAFIDNDIMH